MALTPPSNRLRPSFGSTHNWPLVRGGLCIVLVVAVVSAVIALGVTRREAVRTGRIDESLRNLAHIRAATDEIGRSARRYVLSGDVEDRQLVSAMTTSIQTEREQARTGLSLSEALAVDSALDAYVAQVTRAVDFFDEDFLVRLDRFEVALLDARNQLGVVLDRAIALRHVERADSLDARTIARLASWATAAACVAGLFLALALVIHAERRRGCRSPWENEADVATRSSNPGGSQKIPLEREPHDAMGLIDLAIADHRFDAFVRKVRLRNEGSGTLEILADRKRVAYVLDTLLELAIMRSQPGDEVAVHVAPGDDEVRIAVVDSGQQSRSEASERRIELCRNVIKWHGGRFDVQSAAAGTTAWFTLSRASVRT